MVEIKKKRKKGRLKYTMVDYASRILGARNNVGNVGTSYLSINGQF